MNWESNHETTKANPGDGDKDLQWTLTHWMESTHQRFLSKGLQGVMAPWINSQFTDYSGLTNDYCCVIVGGIASLYHKSESHEKHRIIVPDPGVVCH